MDLLIARVASVVVIALIYMLFDIFNHRNVPNIFAYGTVAYGVLLTALYLNIRLITISGSIAAIILSLGYLLYKAGQLGAADVTELAALSLIIPIQQLPLITHTAQFGLPFVLSVFIAAGVAALILVPLYYVPLSLKKISKPLLSYISASDIINALSIIAAYAAMLAALYLYIHIVTVTGILVIIVMAASSFFTILFSKAITCGMTRNVGVNKLEEGDIIATNLMTQEEIGAARKRLRHFDRLVTFRLIGEIRAKKFRKKLPVYKDALPFAAPLFIAVVFSLLAGNLMLLVIHI